MSKRCCAKMCFNSQTTNKSLNYFAFPKYAQFASEWATAAGREDLLEKKLDSIIKYYLCSEHFTDDCFLDPPHNTRLKKTSHPVHIPRPTIFECNINKYLPPKRSVQVEDEDTDDSNSTRHMITYSPEWKTKSSQLTKLSYQEIPIGTSLLKNNNEDVQSDRLADDSIGDIVINIENIDYSIDDDTFDHMYLTTDDMDAIVEDTSKTDCFNTLPDTDRNDNNLDSNTAIFVCRLCAMVFINDDSLLKIANEPGLCDKLNRLLPNNIKVNDDLPQQICTECYEKLNGCIEILDTFLETQFELKRVYGIS